MSFGDYGFYPEVIPATPDRMADSLHRMENKERTSNVDNFDDLCLTLGDIIHQPHGLIGRSTLVVNVQSENNGQSRWRLLSSRKPEHDILEETKPAIARDPPATWVDKHLTKVPRPQVYSAPDDIVPSLTMMFGGSYEDRRSYVLVMERLDYIDAVQDCAELVTAFEQIVRCHHWVYEEAQIFHRDISVKNLMFRRGEDGSIQGVLNDFDLATPVAQLDNGPTSKQRTGTWPYLAVELLKPSTWLQPPRHLYRYDLESFFWVLLTLAVDPEHPEEHNILQWSACSHTELYLHKSTFLSSAGIDTTPLDPQFEGLRDWLTSLTDLFFEDRRARRRPLSDTTVEVVTAETFLETLSP